MATDNSIFFKLPLEIRQNIYGFASDRAEGSRLILKEYFEKIDTTIERLPPVTAAPAVQVVSAEGEEDEDMSVDGDREGNESDGEAADDDEDEDDEMEADQTIDADDEDEAGNEDHDDIDADDGVADEEEEADEDEGDDDDQDEEDEADEEDDDDGATPATCSTQPSYGRNTKYRHMLPILQLNHCPPPKGLLQTCRQINSEAIEFHRNQCVLTVDVNTGFQHMSMFVETMNQLIDASFSPLEHIRKLRLLITWDSEWLREKSTPPDRTVETDQVSIIGFFFSERLQVMINLLNACPELEKITIEYHDTEDTPESRSFMAERLADLQTAIAEKIYIGVDGFPRATELEMQEHFSSAGTAHARNSVLALRRSEFDSLLQCAWDMR